MFARHKEKENFHVRLQIDVLEQAFGPRMAGAPSLAKPSRRNGISRQNSSVSARRRGGSTSVGTGSKVPLEVEPDAYNSGVDEEKLYYDVIQNLRRAPRAENQDEADNAVRVDDDVVGEDEDIAVVEWDPWNPHMEEGRFKGQLVAACAVDAHSFVFPVAYGVLETESDPAFEESFEEGFDEGFDENLHDFDNDPKYPPNDDSSEVPNGDTSESPNGDQPSVVASSARYLCGRFEEDAQGTDNQEEKRRSNEHKVHEEQSDGKKLKDQTEAPTLFMSNYETL
ncbi:hypothetical protein D1007_58114 [Hordeum vulgare]|nr:hypothetical protein D1007_58114 [Hordeum vulgare]